MRMGVRGEAAEGAGRRRGTMPGWTSRDCANSLNAQRAGSRTPAPVPIFFFCFFFFFLQDPPLGLSCGESKTPLV